MRQVEVQVNTAVGLHARPAANLVQIAKGFQAEIAVERGGRRANAKSLLSVLSLGVKAGETIAVRAEGVDEAEALAAIAALAATGFGEARQEV